MRPERYAGAGDRADARPWAGAGAGLAEAALPATATQGKHCTILLPPGWSIAGENSVGPFLGADVVRNDGGALASYFLGGVTAAMRTDPTYGRWYRDPVTAVYATLSQLGTQQVRCGPPAPQPQGLSLMECQTPSHRGLALFQSFPTKDGGFVLVIRTAGTVPSRWATDIEVASAVARSFRCVFQLRLPAIDWTSGPRPGSSRPRRKGDSEYSPWLGMEHYEDPRTGENFWVSPSTDWHENGPRGPGYYAKRGGELHKLEPGRSD